MSTKTPAGLGVAGKRLWRGIYADLADAKLGLSFAEQELLRSACVTADVVANLERMVKAEGLGSLGSMGQPVLNPGIAAAAAGRLQQARLLGLIGLPNGATATTAPVKTTFTSRRAQNAANVRWERRDAARAS